MAIPPQLFEQEEIKLSKQQIKSLNEIEQSIDMVLDILDGPGKQRVLIPISLRPPDYDVLIKLGSLYYKKGWQNVVIFPNIDSEFEKKGFWKIMLVKHSSQIPDSPIRKWKSARGR